MKNDKKLNLIIKNFRRVLEEIFDLSSHRDYVVMLFTGGYEEVIYSRINDYFNQMIVNYPHEEAELEVMRDGVCYLIERINQSSLIVKRMIYSELFYDENHADEAELIKVFGDHN